MNNALEWTAAMDSISISRADSSAAAALVVSGIIASYPSKACQCTISQQLLGLLIVLLSACTLVVNTVVYISMLSYQNADYYSPETITVVLVLLDMTIVLPVLFWSRNLGPEIHNLLLQFVIVVILICHYFPYRITQIIQMVICFDHD